MEEANAKTFTRKTKVVVAIPVTFCTRAFPNWDPLCSLLQLHTSHPQAVFQPLHPSNPLLV